MVVLTRCLFQQFTKRPGTGKGTQRWVDSLRVNCKGGNGGHGLPQYGGNGGNGGSVILKTPVKENKRNPTNLYTIFHKNFKGDPQKQKLEGKNGAASSKARLIGAKGEDITLTVELFNKP